MRLIKPQAITLGGRPMVTGNNTELMVTSMTGFEMSGTFPVLTSDQKIWKALKDVLPPKTAPDLMMPKFRSEWLAFGKAFPTNSSAKEVELAISITRNKEIISEKILYVTGPRKWTSYAGIAMPGKPENLSAPLLLDWQLAFGSKSNPINPNGIGQYDSDWVGKLMPQIEYKNNPLASPSENSFPAGFGPLPIEASGRFKPKGTYNERWRKEEYPGFPSDTPPEQFMMSAPDQQMDEAFLPGDIITCSGMHPKGEVVRWVLPDWQARCYITLKDSGKQLYPIKMQMDTLWLIPHVNLLGMMWRGTIPIQETDAYDVDLLFGALEDADSPRTESDYALQIDIRSGEKEQTTALMMLDDSGLLPKGQNGLILPEIPQNAKDRINKAMQHAIDAQKAGHDHGTPLFSSKPQ